jgi:hypothetical protein
MTHLKRGDICPAATGGHAQPQVAVPEVQRAVQDYQVGGPGGEFLKQEASQDGPYHNLSKKPNKNSHMVNSCHITDIVLHYTNEGVGFKAWVPCDRDCDRDRTVVLHLEHVGAHDPQIQVAPHQLPHHVRGALEPHLQARQLHSGSSVTLGVMTTFGWLLTFMDRCVHHLRPAHHVMQLLQVPCASRAGVEAAAEDSVKRTGKAVRFCCQLSLFCHRPYIGSTSDQARHSANFSPAKWWPHTAAGWACTPQAGSPACSDVSSLTLTRKAGHHCLPALAILQHNQDLNDCPCMHDLPPDARRQPQGLQLSGAWTSYATYTHLQQLLRVLRHPPLAGQPQPHGRPLLLPLRQQLRSCTPEHGVFDASVQSSAAPDNSRALSLVSELQALRFRGVCVLGAMECADACAAMTHGPCTQWLRRLYAGRAAYPQLARF